ncbi:hypothetical protein [Blautia sp. MSJ-9]|uniref:hypothetical protein n=1 Tax=Blautia sp. MSJ-9 TaxID=2841511 RepID=UPI001C11403E|nr:hypothetical protein [Blautia sp. MSJ-9]MBU5679001.1 hypothetical protein [Blautia sp. MSJ-9]
MSGFPRQDEIDAYYAKKKKEVGEWLIEYAGDQKRLTQEQRRQILVYAEQMSFSMAGEVNVYVQNLKTVGKREKERLQNYMSQIDWLPEGVNTGTLDGKVVCRVLPRPLEKLFGDNDWKSKKEE